MQRVPGLVNRALCIVLLLLGALALIGSLAACAPGGARKGAGGPRLSFQDRSHDFGKVSASQKTEYRFVFTNTGSRPLEIKDIRLEPANPGG
jgi:hypothetical protein